MKLRVLAARLSRVFFDWWVDDLRLSPHLEEWKPGAGDRIAAKVASIVVGNRWYPEPSPGARWRRDFESVTRTFPWMCGKRVTHHLARFHPEIGYF
jgi:hypothetical protein